MIRKEAIEIISAYTKNNPIVSANGFISRDLFEIQEKESNFYMIGSMGLASSIGLGIALKNPKKIVFVFDGDGNILMNLGSLVTIGSLRPKNLIHIVFDNNSHESTGGQPTNAAFVKIDLLAKIANYKVFKTNSKRKLGLILDKIKNIEGPILVLIKIKKSNYVSKRIDIESTLIKTRFMKAIRTRK